MVSSSPLRQHVEAGHKEGDGDFKTELLALIPFLRAFARSLTGNQEGADDLAQETLVKAWQSRATFIPGTNLKAWLFTILHNLAITRMQRNARRGRHDTLDDVPDSAIARPATQEDRLGLRRERAVTP